MRRRLPETLLHERVRDEWSFVETMRHLVFADDVWVGRMLRGGPSVLRPAGSSAHRHHRRRRHRDGARAPRLAPRSRRSPTCTPSGGPGSPGCSPRVTDAELPEVRTAVLAPEWGEESFTVLDCLTTVVREHADHLRFARRDLAVLDTAPRRLSASVTSH